MALSLGVSVGDKIMVGKVPITILSIASPNIIGLDVGGQTFFVSDAERVEILPEVWVQSGLPERRFRSESRLAFEAPREIRIERVRQ